MKGNLTRGAAAAWMLIFIFLDAMAFKGNLSLLNLSDFTFVFILAASFYVGGFGMAVTALAGGIAMDAISPIPVHTPLFVGAYYIARLHEKLFYNPGSPVHMLSFIPIIFIETVIMFLCTGLGPGAMGIPALRILAAGTVNCFIFLAMLTLFHKRDKAVMFKMR